MQASLETSTLFTELLGEKGHSRAAAVEAFDNLGVQVAPRTIPGLRTERYTYSGNRIKARLNYHFFAEKDDATAKLDHYLEIGQLGVDLRMPQKRRPHRLSMEGLLEGIAEQLNLVRMEVNRRMRAIRLDICYGENMEPDQRIGSMFSDRVNEYVDSYTKPENSEVNGRVKIMGERWDGLTIGSFYRTLYEETYGAGIATWVPYEAEFIRDYYQMLGKGERKLSPFDHFALNVMMQGRVAKCVEELREQTGILVEDTVIYSHLGVLTGPPTPRT